MIPAAGTKMENCVKKSRNADLDYTGKLLHSATLQMSGTSRGVVELALRV